MSVSISRKWIPPNNQHHTFSPSALNHSTKNATIQFNMALDIGLLVQDSNLLIKILYYIFLS